MLRSKPTLTVLQKAYDDSYLTCSTAVYYESQGNEVEAMRCWKTALDQIGELHVGGYLPKYASQTETESALVDSLRQLGLQCKERIDLLEALRLSRQEDHSRRPKLPRIPSDVSSTSQAPNQGWIGEGTVPAVTYPELSRPVLPPRPSLLPPTPSGQTAAGLSGRDHSLGGDTPGAATLPPYATSSPRKPPSRSPSPDKHTLRTTLRSGKTGERQTKTSRRSSSKPSEGPGANKAAAVAWTALGLGGRSTPRQRRVPSTVALNSGPQSPTEVQNQAPAPIQGQWDSHTRRLVPPRERGTTSPTGGRSGVDSPASLRSSGEFLAQRPSSLSINAAASALSLSSPSGQPRSDRHALTSDRVPRQRTAPPSGSKLPFPIPEGGGADSSDNAKAAADSAVRRKPVASRPQAEHNASPSESRQGLVGGRHRTRRQRGGSSSSFDENGATADMSPSAFRDIRNSQAISEGQDTEAFMQSGAEVSSEVEDEDVKLASAWKMRKAAIMKTLPAGVDELAAQQILNEIVIRGDEVHWSDIAGLEIAKSALREAVVYPFLRPDLFMGLREPTRGMLLFGPPGTGKTMLARAVATESKSTFFSISASSLTSKFLGESEKLVRALFALAKLLAPSIIFVDEIDSLLSQRSGSGEHEATRRIKTEFLIQWSDLQRAAAGRDPGEKDKERGDPNRVLVLAATNMPWAIDEAARRRFVRRQYIPLPEARTRETQLRTLLGEQKHSLGDSDIQELVDFTEGFSGSDITALAKDAAMGPLRSLGEALLHMTMDEIRPIEFIDFLSSLETIRPSVSKSGLREYEDWAKQFGERGG